MKRLLLVIMCGMALLITPRAAAAQGTGFEQDRILVRVLSGPPGSTREIGRIPISESASGDAACLWSARIENQQSVHRSNDIIFRINGDEVVLADVEAFSGKVTTGGGPLSGPGTLVVLIRFGSEGFFSGGDDIVVTYGCPVEVPTTTAAPTTTVPTTTTTEAPAPTVPPAPTTPAPTTPAPTTTSSTVPPTPTTTAAVTTSTSVPDVVLPGVPVSPPPATTTTTVVPDTVLGGTTPLPDTLPETGSDLARIVWFAAVAIVVGFGLVRRQPDPATG